MSVILVLCVFGRELTDIHCCALVQQVGLSPPNLPYVGVPAGPKVGHQSPCLPGRSLCSMGHFIRSVTARRHVSYVWLNTRMSATGLALAELVPGVDAAGEQINNPTTSVYTNPPILYSDVIP